jgi:hypothetical protein
MYQPKRLTQHHRSLWMRRPSRRSRGSRDRKCFGRWGQRSGHKLSHGHFGVITDSYLGWRSIRHDWRCRRRRRQRRHPLHRLLECITHCNRLGRRCRGTSNTRRQRHQIRRARSHDGRGRAVGAEQKDRNQATHEGRAPYFSKAAEAGAHGWQLATGIVWWKGARVPPGESKYHSRDGVTSLDGALGFGFPRDPTHLPYIRLIANASHRLHPVDA